MEGGESEVKGFVVKILIPALVAVAIRLAIVSKRKTLTLVNILSSFVIGVGFAYLFSDYVIAEVEQKYWSVVISLIAISGEKIGNYLIYRFNVENVLRTLAEKYKK